MTSARLIGGRYEIGELIGYGGMAEVHRGRDVRLGRDVAVKVLRADLARDQTFLVRFRREAQSAAGLNHPAIVAVYDTGEDGDAFGGAAVPYIVMEFVEGRTLRDVLKGEGRLAPRRAMEIVAEVCSALDFSHRNGIVHRDIKPANVMITTTGAVKVMDFGIARALSDNAATVTQTAAVIGTAQYLSPEQARGESVDPRSDVYSTGCLLYELVVGHPPFMGDSPVAVAYQHVRETAPTPSSVNPEIPRALDSIVMKALAKNPLNRYQSAAEMRSDLLRALADRPVEAESVLTDAERTQFISRVPPGGPPPVVGLRHDDQDPPEKDNGRRSALVWTAVVVALLLVIGAGAYAIVALGKSDKPKTFAVTNVIGQTQDAARQALTALGFNNIPPIGPSAGPCDGGVKGVENNICTQDPAANTQVTKDTPIKLTYYKAPTVQVQGVVGKQFSEASVILQNAGLVVKEAQQASSQPTGTVLKQDPDGGKFVPPRSTVTLTVSTGTVPLPNVVGQKSDAAKTTLNKAGWTDVTVVPQVGPDKTKDGLVVAEDPQPGIAYQQQGTAVHLTVYQYQLPPCPSSSSSSPPPASNSASNSASGSTSASTSPSTAPSSKVTTPTGPPTCQPG